MPAKILIAEVYGRRLFATECEQRMILKVRRLIVIQRVRSLGETISSGALRDILATNLRRLRREKGYSQEAFGRSVWFGPNLHRQHRTRRA